MDTVTLVGRTRNQLSQEGDIVSGLFDGEMVVSHALQVGFDIDHLMEMRGKERSRTFAAPAVQELKNRLCYGITVESACSAPDLVEDDKTAVSDIVEDVCKFEHLNHERALPA